jgi:hypothetical protein
MEVCLLSQQGNIAFSSTPIRSITERLSLFPSSFTRHSVGAPYGCLPLRENSGLTMFSLDNRMG